MCTVSRITNMYSYVFLWFLVCVQDDVGVTIVKLSIIPLANGSPTMTIARVSINAQW